MYGRAGGSSCWASRASASASTGLPRSTGPRSTSPTVRSSRFSGRADPERRRCCASSPASRRWTRVVFCSTAETSTASRRIDEVSGSSSRITHSFRIETCRATCRSACGCAVTHQRTRKHARPSSSISSACVGSSGVRWGRFRAASSSGSHSRARSRPSRAILLLDEPLGSLDRQTSRPPARRPRPAVRRGRRDRPVRHPRPDGGVQRSATASRSCAPGGSCRSRPRTSSGRIPQDEDVARFLGLGNVTEGEVVRPEAVRCARGRRWNRRRRASASAHGPIVRLDVRLDDGRRLESVVAAVDHPRPGDRVDVMIDPEGSFASDDPPPRRHPRASSRGCSSATPSAGRPFSTTSRAGSATIGTALSRRSSKASPTPSSASWTCVARVREERRWIASRSRARSPERPTRVHDPLTSRP